MSRTDWSVGVTVQIGKPAVAREDAVRAVRITTLDGPSAVEYGEVAEPDAPEGAVVIDVHAAGVTFPEVLQTRGLYQIKPDVPFIPGAEVAGVVRSAPEGAHVRAGDRVAAFSGFGGYAEVVATAPQVVFSLPDSVSFAAGALIPMNYLTMEFGLFRRGNLRAGETVLVHGAAGGIGTATAQLARAAGAHVIGVASSPEKAAIAKAAGAHEVVTSDGFKDQVKELTGGRGVDMVVDPVGGDRFTDSLRSIATEGRVLVIGFTGGDIPTVKVNRLLLNNISVIGVGWGSFWQRDPSYLQTQWARLEPLVRDGTIDPVVGHTYPLADAARAIADLDERRAVGKIVLTVRD